MKVEQLENGNILFTDSDENIIAIFSNMISPNFKIEDDSVFFSDTYSPDNIRDGVLLKASEVTAVNGVEFSGNANELKKIISTEIKF